MEKLGKVWFEQISGYNILPWRVFFFNLIFSTDVNLGENLVQLFLSHFEIQQTQFSFIYLPSNPKLHKLVYVPTRHGLISDEVPRMTSPGLVLAEEPSESEKTLNLPKLSLTSWQAFTGGITVLMA